MPKKKGEKKMTLKQKVDALIAKYGRKRDIRKVVEVRDDPGLLRAINKYRGKQEQALKAADGDKKYMKGVKME